MDKHFNFLKILVMILSLNFLISCQPKPDSPSGVLRLIGQYSKENNYDAVRNLVYNVSFDYTDRYNGQQIKYESADEVIKGIKENKNLGSFAFSHQSIQDHAEVVDKYLLKNNQYLTDVYLYDHIKNDIHLKKLINENPGAFWFYINHPTVLIFLYENNTFKLLFTHNMTVVAEYDPAKQKTEYTPEEYQEKYGKILKK